MIRSNRYLAILLCFAGCDSVRNAPRPLARSATLDLYVVSTSPVAGAKQVIDPATNTPLYLTTSIITAADVATVQRSENTPQDPSLTVNLTPAGATKLSAATATPAGMRAAIVVNGSVVAAPTVRSQLSSSFQISGSGVGRHRDQLFAALTED